MGWRSLVVAALLCVSSAVWADHTVQCPSCHTSVTIKDAPVGHGSCEDWDLMPQGADVNKVLVDPVTCEHCKYTALAETFDSPAEAPVKPDVPPSWPPMTRALGTKQPAFLRHDLMAQSLRTAHATHWKVGEQYLQAAWSIRLQYNAFEKLSNHDAAVQTALLQKYDQRLQKDWPEPCTRAVQVAYALMKDLGKLPQSQVRPASLLAGSLLYRHGENEVVMKILVPMAGIVGMEGNDALSDVVKSVAWQAHYDELALKEFAASLAAGETDVPRGQVLYLSGELNRRLKHPSEALRLYAEAEKDESTSEVLRLRAHAQQIRIHDES